MRPDVRELATGRWPGILTALGVEDRFLTDKHGPCPICGGKDRFHFDDIEGRGTFFCSKCGAGDGFTLLGKIKGLDFKTMAKEIERIVGTVSAVPPAPTITETDKLKTLTRVWHESHPLSGDDEVVKYLAGRGLDIDMPMPDLLYHPALPYYEDNKLIGKFPAMVALVRDSHGYRATIHRTYLSDGKKANVLAPKKLMPGRQCTGGAIRLFAFDNVLGVAEGIETAIAARQLFGVPTWACVSATMLEKFIVPAGVDRLIVFGDNDASGTGQASAWALAKRLRLSGIDVEVKIPDRVGSDWADDTGIDSSALVLQ